VGNVGIGTGKKMVITKDLKPQKVVESETAIRDNFTELFGMKHLHITDKSIEKHINKNVTDLETAKTYLKSLSKLVLGLARIMVRK
jgi:hypothetical protein